MLIKKELRMDSHDSSQAVNAISFATVSVNGLFDRLNLNSEYSDSLKKAYLSDLELIDRLKEFEAYNPEYFLKISKIIATHTKPNCFGSFSPNVGSSPIQASFGPFEVEICFNNSDSFFDSNEVNNLLGSAASNLSFFKTKNSDFFAVPTLGYVQNDVLSFVQCPEGEKVEYFLVPYESDSFSKEPVFDVCDSPLGFMDECLVRSAVKLKIKNFNPLVPNWMHLSKETNLAVVCKPLGEFSKLVKLNDEFAKLINFKTGLADYTTFFTFS